jgi:hypothetical protein
MVKKKNKRKVLVLKIPQKAKMVGFNYMNKFMMNIINK